MVRSEDFKNILGEEYVQPALKGHFVEVHIPEFAKKFHVTGSMSETGLELSHSFVKNCRVFPGNYMEQIFHKNVLFTSDIL